MDINLIRNEFPILQRKINGWPLVYLDNAATTQKPQRVIDSLCHFYSRSNANIHRGVHTLSVEASEMVDEAREKIADFVGARNSREIIFVRNATEGLNLLSYTMAEDCVYAKDNLILTMMEHHSNLVPWQMLCQKKNAQMRVVEIDEEGRLVLGGGLKSEKGYCLGGLDDLIDFRSKVLVLSMASNVTGVINPVEKIIERVRKKNGNIKIVLDASQMVGHGKLDLKKTGADFAVFSGHKMYGPTGIGALWGKEEELKKMRPFLLGGDMISEVSLEETRFADLPSKFEAGTPAIAEIIGLGAAVSYLKELGMDKIETYERELCEKLLAGMMRLEKEGVIKVIGPRSMESRGPIMSFVVLGVHAHDVATFLDDKGIAVRSGQHCAGPLVRSFGEMATVRVSLSFINTKEEIDYCLEQIAEARRYFLG